METDFSIDITDTLTKFKDYFEHSERMILSAKFGDGKSYLLNKFMEEDDPKNPKYYFVVLHPVNYVVEENRDIFEYIKRDIIFQMLQDEKIFNFESDFDIWNKAITDNISFGEIYDFLLSVQPFAEAKVVGKLIKSGAEKFKKIRESYNDMANKPYNYVDSFALHKGSIAECDGFTQLIQKALQHIEEQYGRKTVLIIEDMDRLDPGHLFRILNVLGAQIDNPYFESDRQEDGERNPNKFGFSKIVLVMDYSTSEHIFHHFYGEEADYEGYMQKFLDVAPFSFSLREEAQKMLMKYIEKACLVDEAFFKLHINYKSTSIKGIYITIGSFVRKLSVRRCKQIISTPLDSFIKKGNNTEKIIRTLRILIALKLILPTEITIQKLYSLIGDDVSSFIDLIYPIYVAFSNMQYKYYSVKADNQLVNYQYDSNTQRSTLFGSYNGQPNTLNLAYVKELWLNNESKVLNYIDFAQ